MAGISWLCPRGSEGGPDAKVPHARPRVGADVDQAIAWISALTVHVWVEARVAGDRDQVLARDVDAGRRGAAEQQARRQVVPERESLKPQVRAVFYERAVERSGAVAIGPRHHRVGVRRVPVIQHAGALVRRDPTVPVEIGDLVLARRAGSLVRQVARGAGIAPLPQAVDLIAVDGAERLAHA